MRGYCSCKTFYTHKTYHIMKYYYYDRHSDEIVYSFVPLQAENLILLGEEDDGNEE